MGWPSTSRRSVRYRIARAYSRVVLERLLKRGALVLFLCLGITCIFLLFSFSGVASFSPVETDSTLLTVDTLSGLPLNVVEDAARIGLQFYGKSKEAEIYSRRLLAAYKTTADKDFLILFNPGGWGVSRIEDTVDWKTIIAAMEAEIRGAGYKVVSLNYNRTSNSLAGKVSELKEIITGYMSKSQELASGMEFLTAYNPNLKIILAGDSTGTMICDSCMNRLKNNARVFSIQTGMPFWQKNTTNERTLALNDNGLVPDAFSRGDLLTVLKASIKTLFGIDGPGYSGKILGFLTSPGHEYYWQAPGVSSSIEYFLESNFRLGLRNAY